MSDKNYTLEQFTALIRKNEETIKRISASFHIPGTPQFREMMSDLTTYLWSVYSKMPPDIVIYKERQWVYTILYRKASNIVRNEKRHQSHLEYDFDFSNYSYSDEDQQLVSRMYRLINHLEQDDREIITMYLDKVPVRQIAIVKNKHVIYIYRRINKIIETLRCLNEEIDDDDG